MSNVCLDLFYLATLTLITYLRFNHPDHAPLGYLYSNNAPNFVRPYGTIFSPATDIIPQASAVIPTLARCCPCHIHHPHARWHCDSVCCEEPFFQVHSLW
jgi:hypothetical protein